MSQCKRHNEILSGDKEREQVQLKSGNTRDNCRRDCMENGAISENSCSSQLTACLQLTGPKLNDAPLLHN